ncbi:hypothetical protein BGZ50_003151 [Haplosporangium sp. Z 11]|nr:hypothetical protein BGZ50_003151 [Haplosporangium sp. Z 11]
MRRNVALDEIANSFKDCSMDADDFSSRQQKRRRTSTRITRATSNLSSQEHNYSISQDDDDKDGDFVMPSQESKWAHKGKNVTHNSSDQDKK